MLWHTNITTLQAANGVSVDCIAFSKDEQFLVVGGQDGRVKIWRWRENKLIATLENAPAWVDKLAWSPTSNQLAYSLGRYVRVWDADTSNITATLNFDTSSVLGLDWRCDGQFLAIAGYQGAKIWHSQDWDDDPYILDVPSASVALAQAWACPTSLGRLMANTLLLATWIAPLLFWNGTIPTLG